MSSKIINFFMKRINARALTVSNKKKPLFSRCLELFIDKFSNKCHTFNFIILQCSNFGKIR